MLLTDDERELLAGAAGHAARKAMQILVALGRIFGADRLVAVAYDPRCAVAADDFDTSIPNYPV